MNIEEMVQWLDDHDDEDWQEKQAIRAALYAGQAMRDEIKHCRWDSYTAQAWDAATKGEGKL